MINNPSAAVELLADAGVPMIVFTFPAMVVALVPVVLVEGSLYKKWLGLPTGQAIKVSAVSNAVSTLVGVPMAWLSMLGLEFVSLLLLSGSPALQNSSSPIANIVLVLLGSAWLGPGNGSRWPIPLAVAVLLVPFFFVSYLIEHMIVNRMLSGAEGEPPEGELRTKLAVRNANLVTYGIMLVGTAVWLIISLPRR